VAARLDRLHGADATPVRLHGVPVKPVGTLRVSGGFVYLSLLLAGALIPDLQRRESPKEELMAFALVDELLEQKRSRDAADIARLAELSGQNIARMYADEGDLQRRYNSATGAEEQYRKALLIDPSNAQAAAGMSALRELGPGSGGR
jgi:hypothetical protein